MAYKGWEMVDTGEYDECKGTYPVKIYVDFDTADEALEFDWLASEDTRFRELMDELGRMAGEG